MPLGCGGGSAGPRDSVPSPIPTRSDQHHIAHLQHGVQQEVRDGGHRPPRGLVDPVVGVVLHPLQEREDRDGQPEEVLEGRGALQLDELEEGLRAADVPAVLQHRAVGAHGVPLDDSGRARVGGQRDQPHPVVLREEVAQGPVVDRVALGLPHLVHLLIAGGKGNPFRREGGGGTAGWAGAGDTKGRGGSRPGAIGGPCAAASH